MTITNDNAEICSNCGRMRKKGDEVPFVCFMPFPSGHRWRAFGEEDPTHLNMNGSPLTVSALAWIANALERHGEVRVTNCMTSPTPGMGAVYLGAELQRLGFFDVLLPKPREDDERNEAHEIIEGMEG